MNIKPISNQEDLTAACARVEQLWGADIDTPEGDEECLDAGLQIVDHHIEKRLYALRSPLHSSRPTGCIAFQAARSIGSGAAKSHCAIRSANW